MVWTLCTYSLNEDTKNVRFVKQNGMDKSPMAESLLCVADTGECKYNGRTIATTNKNESFGFRIFVLTFLKLNLTCYCDSIYPP